MVELIDKIKGLFGARAKEESPSELWVPERRPVVVTRTIEEIFDVARSSEYGASTTLKTAEGVLLDINDKEFTYDSEALFSNHSVHRSGVVLKIENERGSAIAEMPSRIQLGRNLLLNQKVKYTRREWSSLTEGTSNTYTLEILSGPLAGECLEHEVFA